MKSNNSFSLSLMVKFCVSISKSGVTGSSYGESIPVNSFISPFLAFLYKPFGSLSSHVDISADK